MAIRPADPDTTASPLIDTSTNQIFHIVGSGISLYHAISTYFSVQKVEPNQRVGGMAGRGDKVKFHQHRTKKPKN